MATNQTIGTFIDQFVRRDGQRDNLYRIMSLNTKVLSLTEEDLVYARAGKIPARTNPVGTISYHGMKLPYNLSSVEYTGNEDFQIEFVFDARNEIRTKFEQASRLIFNDITNTGNWAAPTLNDIMTVATLDINLEPVSYFTFYGVAFKGMGEVAFNIAEGTGAIVNVPINLSYYYYRSPGSDTVWAGSANGIN